MRCGYSVMVSVSTPKRLNPVSPSPAWGRVTLVLEMAVFWSATLSCSGTFESFLVQFYRFIIKGPFGQVRRILCFTTPWLSFSVSDFYAIALEMSRHPSVKWAQRSDKIYITVELPDAKDVKHKLEAEGKFLFNATRDNVAYEVDLELFDKIDVEQSKANVGVRSIIYVIQKAEKKWWSRLVKQEGKPPAFLKVDWDKWVDEDDEKGGADMDFGDMDFSKLGMGGDDFDMDLPKDDEEENEGEEKETTEEPVTSATDEAKA